MTDNPVGAAALLEAEGAVCVREGQLSTRQAVWSSNIASTLLPVLH